LAQDAIKAAESVKTLIRQKESNMQRRQKCTTKFLIRQVHFVTSKLQDIWTFLS